MVAGVDRIRVEPVAGAGDRIVESHRVDTRGGSLRRLDGAVCFG